VGTIVTNEDAEDFKMREEDLFEEPNDHWGFICGASNGFHPFGHIIYDDQDIFVSSGRWERSHGIHAPNIEDLDFKNIVNKHLIPLRPIFGPLAMVVSPDVILEKGWPLKGGLYNVGRCLTTSCMSTTRHIMAMHNYRTILLFGYTLPYKTISTFI